MNRELYCIAGMKKHGKDTLARFIQEANPKFYITHFADRLKEIAGKVFGLTNEQFNDQDLKEVLFDTPIVMDLSLDALRIETGLDLQKQDKVANNPREILQYFGTEYTRKVQDDYWVQCVLDDVKDRNNVLIPDTRFPNEAKAIRSVGGLVIKVVRVDMPVSTDGHASETQVAAIEPDLLIGATTGDFDTLKKIAGYIAKNDFNTALQFDYRRDGLIMSKY
jgi:hypothetical protein